MLRSINFFFNHKTWLTAAVTTINSVSVIDWTTVSYFLEHHEKVPEPILKQYSEVLFILSKKSP